MKLAAFNAVCPFEIGDKIGMRKNACAVGGRTLDVTAICNRYRQHAGHVHSW